MTVRVNYLFLWVRSLITIELKDWREVPLLTAISHGAKSVEADVWLIDGTLYVGGV